MGGGGHLKRVKYPPCKTSQRGKNCVQTSAREQGVTQSNACEYAKVCAPKCRHEKGRHFTKYGTKTKRNSAAAQIALWLLVFVLAVCMLVFSFKVNNENNLGFSNAIPGDPFKTTVIDGKTYSLIENATDMSNLAALTIEKKEGLNGTQYILGGNITLDSTWTGIGTADVPFGGTFDGGGYTITYDNAKYCLFNYVGEGATIKNIHTAGNLDYSNSSAAIVSYAVGTSTNLVTIEKCKNEARQSATCNLAGMAGIVYSAEYTQISECANLSDLEDSGVSAGSACVGGIVFYAKISTIENCYNAGALTAYPYSKEPESGVGGIVFYAADGVTVTHCYNSGSITSKSLKDAIARTAQSSKTITDCYYLSGGSSSYGTAKTESELKAGNFANWDFQTIWCADGTNYPTLRALEKISVPTFVFTIVYNNGTAATTNYSLAEGATQILPALSYEGYKFNGWLITNDAGTNKSIVSKSGDDYILTAGDGEATITAQWSQIVFSLTLNCASLAGENYMAYIYRGNDIIMQVSLTKGQTTIKLPYVADYANNKYSICFVFAYCGNIKFTSLTNAEISAKSERNIVISKFDSTTETASVKYEIANPRVNTTVII